VLFNISVETVIKFIQDSLMNRKFEKTVFFCHLQEEENAYISQTAWIYIVSQDIKLSETPICAVWFSVG